MVATYRGGALARAPGATTAAITTAAAAASARRARRSMFATDPPSLRPGADPPRPESVWRRAGFLARSAQQFHGECLVLAAHDPVDSSSSLSVLNLRSGCGRSAGQVLVVNASRRSGVGAE